jgi:protein SCO1/2
LVCASIVGIGLLSTACGGNEPTAQPTTTTTTTAPEPTEFSGYVRSPQLNVSSVTLPAVDGTPVNMVADPGGLRLVYFGFTFCPDICPATLSFVKKSMAALPEADRDRVQLDVISVDPRRDTPERLEEYVTNFVPSGNAIRTEDRKLLYGAAEEFGAEFKARINDMGEREISHTADLYVVDDTGTIVLAWPFGTAQDAMERDLIRLLAGDRPPAEPPVDPATTPTEEQQ